MGTSFHGFICSDYTHIPMYEKDKVCAPGCGECVLYIYIYNLNLKMKNEE